MPMASQVGGFSLAPTASYTRPANTTAYSAGKVLANSTSAAAALQFNVARASGGGSGLITTAFLIDESNPGTAGQFELWLFNAALSAIVNDAGTWTLADADAQKLVGIIPFGTTTYAAGTAALIYQPMLNAPLPFAAVDGLRLYGQIVVRNAYTPASAGVIRVGLGLQAD